MDPASNRPKQGYLRWAARIWSIGPILFASGEVFFPHSDPGVEMHWTEWLPVILLFGSVAGLAIAWRWERFGALFSLVAFVAALGSYWIVEGEFFPLAVLVWLINVVGPAILFLMHDYLLTQSKNIHA